MNIPKQKLYDSLYRSAICNGWSGWGGDTRIADGPVQVEKILSKPYVPRSGKILEAGCGEGHLCRLFCELGYEVTGVDISSVAIDWAQEKNSVQKTTNRYLCADLSDSSFYMSERFDLIIDGNCLHCITGEKRLNFLNNIADLMADHGIFFISSLCSRDNENHKIYRNNFPYRFIPSVSFLSGEMVQAGFTLLDSQISYYPQREYDHVNMYLGKAIRFKA